MTDARLPDRWNGSPRFDELSDAAWRVFTNALMWSNGHGTDGAIPRRYVSRLHPDPDADVPAACAELVAAELWVADDEGGYELKGWNADLGQSLASDVTKQKEANRQRAQRNRDAKNAARSETGSASSGEGDDASAANVRPDVRADVGQDRTGPPQGVKREGERAGASPFCPAHSPNGPAGARCPACGDARRAFDHAKSQTPTGRSVVAPPTTAEARNSECGAHPGYPVDCPRCSEESAASGARAA